MALHSEDHVGEAVLHNFAKRLANNEPRLRKIALRKLQKWLETRSDVFGEPEFIKIWKGLHYCMWMTDKPLIQDELAERITQMVHRLRSFDTVLRFISTFFTTEAREWSGTDHLRMDKFMSLIRKMLRQSLVAVQRRGWTTDDVSKLTKIFYSTLLDCTNDRIPDGIRFHFDDIYLDELTRVDAEQLSPEQVLSLIDPFCRLISKSSNKILVGHTLKTVFGPLIRRNDSDEEEEDSIQLTVDRSQLADKLMKLASKRSCRNRAAIYRLIKRCREPAAGQSEGQDQDNEETSDVEMNGIEADSDEVDIARVSPAVKINPLSAENPTEENPQQKKGKKKSKKLKRDEVIASGNMIVENGFASHFTPESSIPVDPAGNVNDALERERSVEKAAEEAGDSPVGRKRKRKEVEDVGKEEGGKASDTGNQLEEEIEIWIPNKKYKKAAAAEGTVTVEKSGIEKKKSMEKPFMTFMDVEKTPTALVRKRLKSPKSEPQQRRKLTDPVVRASSTEQQKRVKFAMNLNKSQNFEDSLNVTPKPPFDPRLQPDRTILKPSPVGSSTKTFAKSTKQKLFVKRARASDFF